MWNQLCDTVTNIPHVPPAFSSSNSQVLKEHQATIPASQRFLKSSIQSRANVGESLSCAGELKV